MAIMFHFKIAGQKGQAVEPYLLLNTQQAQHLG